MMCLSFGLDAWVPFGSIALVCGPEKVNSWAALSWANDELYKKGMRAENGTDFLMNATKNMIKKRGRQASLVLATGHFC